MTLRSPSGLRDAFTDAPNPHPIDPLRKLDGRYVQVGQEPSDESTTDGLEPFKSYGCAHRQLRGRRRCMGCGRTRNEIAIEEGR